MNVSVSGSFVYFTIPVLGGIPITQTTVSSLIVTVFLMLTGYFLGRNLQKRPTDVQVLVEKGVDMIYGMVSDTMGAHNLSWAPFIGTIFLSSICGTYIGLLGFFRSMTADLSTTLTWSLMVSVLIWYNNIKRNGFVGWLKGFTEPIAVMTPMNLISEIAQPISMAFRHFGNVAGGGVITSILYTALAGASTLVLDLIASSGIAAGITLLVVGIALIVWGKLKHKTGRMILGFVGAILGFFGLLQGWSILSGVPVLAYGIPAALSVYFDLFSGFVQALVFSLLTMVYIAGACPPPEEQG